jgi:hypothetical protein
LFYRIVGNIRYESRREQYLWEKNHKVPLPAQVTKRQVFEGLQEAVQQRFCVRENMARENDDVLVGSKFEEHALYDEVGCVIVGLPINKTHHIAGARRVIPHLKSLVEDGLVSPHYHDGSSTQSGWHFTELGERVAEGLVEFSFDDE